MTDLIASWLPESCAGVAWVATALIDVALMLGFVLVAVAFFVWLERKVSARIQDRLGPTRVGGRFGWLQSPADGIKLLCKEDIIPSAADRILFRMAPYLSFCPAFAAFAAIPLADGWVALRLDIAALFVLAIAGMEVFGVILAGYASGSKYSLFGAMREAAQVVSYEAPLALCLVIPVMLAGSMDLTAIAQAQEGWFTQWFLFHNPFSFAAFWIFVVCATANTNRAPFDLPEAESELVAGFMTEYSGFRWAVFFMAEYTAMLAVCLIASIAFLGGWNGPIPWTGWLGLSYSVHPALGFLGDFVGFLNLTAKAFVGVMFIMALRWTLPRLRIDQVMAMCWKYCVPLAAAMLIGATVWLYLFPGGAIGRFRDPSPLSPAVATTWTALGEGERISP